jgi:NhaP-type Na+/H+ or K+/H+ antiporter
VIATDPLTGLVLILALGVGAQWLAWRANIPSIVLLLATGVLAGPVLGWIDPDALFGSALLPGVSLAVGIILFEGGLTLRAEELRRIGPTVWRLCSVGALVSWTLSAATAHYVLGLPWPISALLGAVLVVTGPTVVQPLLRHLRLTEPAASLLRWEGILIDPVGAVLAVLVFEALVESGGTDVLTAETLLGLASAAIVGTVTGVAGAWGLRVVVGRYYLPDYLQNPVVLATVAAALLVADCIRQESGLVAVVVMGMVLGGAKKVPIRSILAFKESLRVLIIGTLFIVLSARLDLSAIRAVLVPGTVLLIALVLVVRPISVLASTIGADISWRSRIMLMAMAPRGIVAAAVSSVFALELGFAGFPNAERLVSLTFFVIAGSVAIYAVLAPVVARQLSLIEADPQGVLFCGAPAWVRDAAKTLLDLGLRVQLVDTDYFRMREARMAGLPAVYGNPLSERTEQDLDLRGIGRMLAVSANDDTNSLAALHFTETFGRSEVYQLSDDRPTVPRGEGAGPSHLRGRRLFGANATYREMERRYDAGARLRRTRLSEEFEIEDFVNKHGNRAIPLFLIQNDGTRLYVFATDGKPTSKPGDVLVSLVLPEEDRPEQSE